MRALPVLLVVVALGAGAIGTAVTAVNMNPPSITSTQSGDWERSRPGPDSGRVAILIDALGRTDPVVCELIGDQLGNFWWGGDRAGVGRLAGASMTVQAAKDSIGGKITDDRAIRRLVAELDAPSACTRRVASKLLGHSAIGGAQLNALLSDGSANVRESAALAAGTGDRHDATPSLERALDDKTPAVAAMAAWALGEIEDRASLSKLLAHVRAGDTRVRLAAIWALGQLEDSRAVRDIAATLRDPNASIRAMSADVLGDIENTDATGPLESVLASDTDANVRAAAAHSLGEVSAASSAPALGRALSDADMSVRRAAAEALGDLDELRTAPPGLAAALASNDPELRHHAAKALASIADPALTSALVGLLSDPDAGLRKDAVESLGEIGTPAAVQAITKALNDRDPQVRKAAAEALGDIKDD